MLRAWAGLLPFRPACPIFARLFLPRADLARCASAEASEACADPRFRPPLSVDRLEVPLERSQFDLLVVLEASALLPTHPPGAYIVLSLRATDPLS